MSNKIKIKFGAVEVEYEGSEEYIKNELLNMLKSVIEIYKDNKDIASISTSNSDNPPEKSNINLSISSIASKLGCKSGPQLIMAAAVYITFTEKKGTFSRSEIINQMKDASGFYKKSYLGNLTQSLNNLVKTGSLNESSTDHFSLPDNYKKEIINTIAD